MIEFLFAVVSIGLIVSNRWRINTDRAKGDA